MLNFKTLAIIKMELHEKLMSKSFIVMTIIMPVIMLGIMGIQSLIVLYQGDKGSRVEILTESDALKTKFQTGFAELDLVKNATYIVDFKTVSSENLKGYIQNKKPELLSHKLNAIIFIPSKAIEDKQIEYYSNTPGNISIHEKLRDPINKVLIDQYFLTKNLSQEDIAFARKDVKFDGFKVSEKDEMQEQGFGNTIIAVFLTFMLYMSLIFGGTMTMQTVQKEKSNKIVEVLLSSVSSKDLMTGKIIGVTITSIAQMIIWLLPVLALISTSWFVLPEKMTVDISYGHLIYFLINFLLAVLIYQGLFATAGAIFDNSQDAQPVVMPIMMLLLIPLFISMSMMQNPNNPLAVISSFVPFATLIVMPARFALVDMPVWQLGISILINIATIFAIFPLAGKIYSVGILRVGKKPSWSEVVKWIKYKY
jgi:ABC-2 type transport system permease protein